MKLWGKDCQRKQNDINCAEELAPKIYGFFDLLAIGVGSSIAVGISELFGEVISNVTGPSFVVSIALAGLAALFAGLCFAEFGVRFLKVNSAYAYSYVWSSENLAFVFGWALILQYVTCTASAAKGIITFTDALVDYKITKFLREIVSTNSEDVFPYFDFLSLAIPVVVTILYVIGKKDSIVVKKIFTICNAVLVTSIIIIGAFKADAKNWEIKEFPHGEAKNSFAPFGVIGIVKGAALGFYGFIGFDKINVSGNEVRKRKRNLPLAILATILITLLAYEGVGSVLTLMVPFYSLKPHATVPFAFEEIEWPAVKWVTAVATFFGFQTSLFGAVYSLPSVIQSMANDGLLFHCLGKSHSVTKIPIAAALTGGLITAAVTGIFPFHTLVNAAVTGALFVCTVLATSVVLFRYSPKFDSKEKLSESWMNLINNDSDVSVKAVMQNYFNFKENQPTNLTKIIVTGNLVLFCLSSIGISVIFTYFYESLTSCSYWAVIPAGILLCAMFFNLISMTCQPKCREIIPFTVPLIPIVPCLSIFLNIFLMVTFGSLTWILFSIWMAVGLIPYFTWRLLKYLRGDTGQNSLYEINRTNSLKLNESIWKIKKDKKSYYEGTINSVFSEDLEDNCSANSKSEVKKQNEKLPLQLMQAEIIQTAEMMPEEKAEPLDDALEFNFVQVNNEEVVSDLQEDEKVRWECVAEIHTEEESSQENVALEIVDNTYNFLTQVSEELLKSDGKHKETDSTTDPETAENNGNSESESTISQSGSSPLSEKRDKCKDCKLGDETYGEESDLVKEGRLNAIELEVNNNNNEKDEYKNEYSNNLTILNKEIVEKNLSETLKHNSEVSKDTKNSLEILSETPKSGTVSPKETRTEKSEEVTSVTHEQNKVKDFKEKLNLLLKNQISNESILNRNSVNTRPSDGAKEENQDNKKDLDSDVKTLNRSEVKGKLEFLFSKGPPKRPSLGGSFNIKIKEANKAKEVEKANDEAPKSQNHGVLESEDNFVLPSSTLQDNIRKKILLLKSASNNRTTDALC